MDFEDSVGLGVNEKYSLREGGRVKFGGIFPNVKRFSVV